VFAVLDPKYYAAQNQHALLGSVMATLKKRYPSTPRIKPDGQAVTITSHPGWMKAASLWTR
jgi:hypothetical protein